MLLSRLVTAFMLACVDYCNAIWVALLVYTLAPLQRILHAAAIKVLNLKPCDHTSCALRDSTGVQSLRGYSRSCACWYTTHLSATLHSANASIWHSVMLRAFRIVAPCTWNHQLPTHIKMQRSTSSFKRHLKSHVLTATNRSNNDFSFESTVMPTMLFVLSTCMGHIINTHWYC